MVYHLHPSYLVLTLLEHKGWMGKPGRQHPIRAIETQNLNTQALTSISLSTEKHNNISLTKSNVVRNNKNKTCNIN